MAYEISSSVAAGEVLIQTIDGGSGTRSNGGRFSPDGSKLAALSYRHGGAGSTDYGIDIYTSASSGGWTRTESIDNGSDVGNFIYWVTNDQIYLSTESKLVSYVSASDTGWDSGTNVIANHGGFDMVAFSPTKKRIIINELGDATVRVYNSGSNGVYSFGHTINPDGSRVESFVWLDNDDELMLGSPAAQSNAGRLEVWKTTDDGDTFAKTEHVNGTSNQYLGASLYYSSGSGNIIVGTGVQGSYSNTSTDSGTLVLLQSSSAGGYLPASTSGAPTITSSIYVPFHDAHHIATDPGNTQSRFIVGTRGTNGSPYSGQLHAVESGSAGWKSTLISSTVHPEVHRGQIDISKEGHIVSNDNVSLNNLDDSFRVYHNFGYEGSPSLDDSSTETVGTSGGSISAGGTEEAPTATVTFPAGALDGNKSITVSVDADNDPMTNGINQSENSYSRSYSSLLRVTLPANTTLSKAATVEIDLDDDIDSNKLVLLKRETSDLPWYVIPASSYTVSSGKVSFTTHRFSDYQAVEDENMARTKINNTQLLKLTQASSVLGGALDITGSTVIGEVVSDEMMFMIQSGSETPKKVLASELATYFNQAVSVTSVSDAAAHKIIFVDAAGSDQTLQADNNSFTYTPSTNLLTVGGSILIGDGSNIGPASVTDLIQLQADGDIIIKDGAYDFDIASHDGTNGLLLGGVTVTADAAEINKLDGVTATTTELNYVDVTSAGTVEASKAVVVDGNKDATSFRNITGTGTFTAYTALSGSKLVVGSADMSESDLEQLDGITAGTVAASKAVVVDSDKDASGFRNVTATGAITGGSFVIGSADISEAELETIDGVTAGTVAASKAVVVDSNKDVTGFRDVTIAGTGSIAGDLVITGNLQVDGSQTIINTTHLEVADKTLLIASGSANSAAADGAGIVVEDIAGDDKSILFQNTGTNFKSSENFDIASGKVYKINNTEVLSATALTIGSAAMSEADLEKLDGITNGTVAASKAVVVDADKDAAGFRNLSASTNVSASAFYGDGSNLTGVGAEVATSAANTEFKLSFVVDAAADAASLLIDSTAHGTYNPSTNKLGVAQISSSADLVLRGGKSDDVQIQPADTSGDVVIFAKGGTIGNSRGLIISGSDTKALVTIVGSDAENNKLQIEAGGSIAEINAAAALTMKAANGAATVTAVGANAVLQRQTGAKVTTTDTTVQIDTPSGTGRTIEFHNNGFKAGELEVYTDSGNADKIALKTAGVNGLSLSASAGTIGISGSHGIQLASVNDTVIDLAADSLYFKDADGKVKSDTISDIMGLVAGTVTTTGIADSSGVLSMAIHSLNAEVIATGDKIAFSDAGDNGLHSETIDDLFKIGPALVTEAAADVADDYILFLDGGASGEAKKESVADLVGSTAGDGLTATNGVLAVAAIEKTFYSASSNTGADGGMSANLLTASLDNSGDGNALANSLEVYLNGMLQTLSSSVATGVTGVFDYKVDNASTPTEIRLQAALDSDDVLIVRYLKK